MFSVFRFRYRKGIYFCYLFFVGESLVIWLYLVVREVEKCDFQLDGYVFIYSLVIVEEWENRFR